MFLINRRRPHKTLMGIAESVRINTQNPASLHRLPAELICEICDYLPIAEIFCLMISCTRLWNRRNIIPVFVKVPQFMHDTYNNHIDMILSKYDSTFSD